MISFPNAKINLGLNIIRKRIDGFHDIESLIFPVGLHDVLEINKSETGKNIFRFSGLPWQPAHKVSSDNYLEIETHEFDPPDNIASWGSNLVIKAYKMLWQDFDIHPVYIHLHKAIPTGAGLGGGSSDGAHALKMLNELFNLGLSKLQLQDYAARLGSDCAFFIDNQPAIASGRGENLVSTNIDLRGYYIYLVKPDLQISTAEAYTWVSPAKNPVPIADLISSDLSTWKNQLVNNFEQPVFERFPLLRDIKTKLYDAGAIYAAMSGSGAAIYGIFKELRTKLEFPDNYFQWKGAL